MPCPSFSIVYRQIDISEFTGPGVWSVSDKYQFADKRQFHPTKHLSWWVLKLEAEWCSTPSIFRLTDIFDFFVPGSPASSKMTTGAMPKHTYGQLSKIVGMTVLRTFKLRGPVCEPFRTNIGLSANDKKWRAGHLKFLVRLKKLVETRGVRFGVASKMRNFIRRNICLDESQS